MASLKEKVAIVTGASRGIGRGIAERLATDGATVVVNYAKNANEADRSYPVSTTVGRGRMDYGRYDSGRRGRDVSVADKDQGRTEGGESVLLMT